METEETYSMGVADSRDGVSLMRRRKVESLVLPAEIMHLKDLELYLQIPNYDLTKTELDWKNYPVLVEPLQFRRDLEMGRLLALQRGPSTETELPPPRKGDLERKRRGLDYDLEIEADQ